MVDFPRSQILIYEQMVLNIHFILVPFGIVFVIATWARIINLHPCVSSKRETSLEWAVSLFLNVGVFVSRMGINSFPSGHLAFSYSV